MTHFRALPHFTIARDDRTKKIERLTSLPIDEYNKVWAQFDSSFWNYKSTIFGVKQKGFCYAGKWSLFVDLSTGDAVKCYGEKGIGNVFENPDEPFPEVPVGRCKQPHCFNAHMLLTLGLIPNATNVRYGDIRNRITSDGREWLQPELKNFFNTCLVESNKEYTPAEKTKKSISLMFDYGKDVINYGKYVISNKLK